MTDIMHLAFATTSTRGLRQDILPMRLLELKRKRDERRRKRAAL